MVALGKPIVSAQSVPDSDRPLVGRDTRRTVLIGVLSGVLFALGLVASEAPGEIALDVDLKPFFIPYLLIAVAGYWTPTLAAAVGAAAGEGLLDVVEGYELDDPVGFVGYVVGFTLFGWYLHRVASDPADRRAQIVAALIGAFGQAAFEGVAFYAFAVRAGPIDAMLSVLGNTVIHGVVLGAVPLLILYPVIEDRARDVASELAR
jgi:hypothetical protein